MVNAFILENLQVPKSLEPIRGEQNSRDTDRIGAICKHQDKAFRYPYYLYPLLSLEFKVMFLPVYL